MLIITLASFLQGLLATVFVTLCVLLCLIILVQKPKGGGLSGAFGGAGGGAQVFGGKSGDVLTWITVSFFIMFLVVAMLLVVVTRNEAREGGLAEENIAPLPQLIDDAGPPPDGDAP